MTTTPPRTLITGAAGQDGQLLIARLEAMGWPVWAAVYPGSTLTTSGEFTHVVEVDLADASACRALIRDSEADVVFHLAAISSVAASWRDPVGSSQINAISSIALMAESLAVTKESGSPIRFVNASSGEIFAGTEQVPQTETTPLSPRSPYGSAKAFAHNMATTFRAQGLAVSNAILYPHESPLRPTQFVTRKITRTAAEIRAGLADELAMGNLEARRDWGWAPDYVDAMIRMASNGEPGDYIVATGQSHTVAEFVQTAFAAAGIENWNDYVRIDPAFLRPQDGADLVGDPQHTSTTLNWHPTKTFTEIIHAMVSHDLVDLGVEVSNDTTGSTHMGG